MLMSTALSMRSNQYIIPSPVLKLFELRVLVPVNAHSVNNSISKTPSSAFVEYKALFCTAYINPWLIVRFNVLDMDKH